MSRWMKKRSDSLTTVAGAILLVLLSWVVGLNPDGTWADVLGWAFVVLMVAVCLFAINNDTWDVLGLMALFALYMVFGDKLVGPGADLIPFQSHDVWISALVALGTVFVYEMIRPGGLGDERANDAAPHAVHHY